MQISQELQWILGAKISLDEVIRSINSQANNKSPAKDGLTTEL